MRLIARILQFFNALQGAWSPGAWWLDAKLGLRMLTKNPGLTLAGGGGIAVGVAIATGGFSVIYGAYLATSIPVDDGSRVVAVEVWNSSSSEPERRLSHDFRLWRRQLASVGELSAFQALTPNLIIPGAAPVSVRVAAMTASGFRVARVPPLLGRYLVDADERVGAPAVAVIGEAVWRARFASDPSILQRTIQLGSTHHAIVGVMPDGFAFPVNQQIWTPLRTAIDATSPLTGPGIFVFGRLAPGVTIESAQAELSAVTRRAAAADPKAYARLHTQVLPYPRPFLGVRLAGDVSGLHMMQGTVTLLLLLVCLNVAILVYARTARRQAEIAIRTALGAKRGRIVGQLFVEGLVLSMAGTAAGVAIAAFALQRVKTSVGHIASDLPFWLSFDVSSGAVGYAGVLSVLAAVIVGVVPAIKLTGRDVQTGLRGIGAGGSGLRLGKTWTVLVVAQVGFAVAFLPAAAFNGWRTARAGIAGPGFPAAEYLTAELAGGRRDDLIRRLESEPAISAITLAMSNPGEGRGATIEASTTGSTAHAVQFHRVDVNYFRAFGIPVLSGRGFVPADATTAPDSGGAVVVNQTLARRFFGGGALGGRIRYSGMHGAEPGPWHEIVGIVPDFPAGVSPNMADSPVGIYHPVASAALEPATLLLRIRGGSPEAFAPQLRQIAAAIDPDIQVRRAIKLEEALRREQWIRRLEAGVFLAVALSVLALSSAGIYAMMSFTIAQRKKEIAIRLALGANGRQVVASIFSRALMQLGSGAALGMILGLGLERASGNQLLEGNAAIVLPAVAVTMVAVGFLSALGPALRGLSIQPTESLREQ